MKKALLRAGGMLLAMTVLCGFGYTFAVTGLGQLLFPHQAGGSVIEIDGKTYGSELLAQPFTKDEYLWGRIMNLDVTSFETETGEPALYAWASNLSPASEEFEALVAQRVGRAEGGKPGNAGRAHSGGLGDKLRAAAWTRKSLRRPPAIRFPESPRLGA